MRGLRQVLGWLLAVCTAAMLSACSGGEAPEKGPVVLAASSLQEAMEAAADAWAAEGHARPVMSFAATPALARQIENGAPADLFVSADEPWMDTLEGQGLIRRGSRAVLVGNSLVLVAPIDRARSVDLAPPEALTGALGQEGRLALADPDSVPAGRYAKAALISLNLWRDVEARLARAENVRAALALVERGEAPLGIVYATDAKASDKVRVAATIPSGAHPAIRYPVAVVNASSHPDAEAFRAFLVSPKGLAAFERFGFVRPR